jgi:hypothetical protein
LWIALIRFNRQIEADDEWGRGLRVGAAG